MDWIDPLAKLIGQIGLPAVLVLGGGWFVTRRVWPDLMTIIWPDVARLAEVYAAALANVARALERVAEKLPDPPPSGTLGNDKRTW
jgi:hypothetical protein